MNPKPFVPYGGAYTTAAHAGRRYYREFSSTANSSCCDNKIIWNVYGQITDLDVGNSDRKHLS